MKGVARAIVIESHATPLEDYKRTGANYDRRSATMRGTQIDMPFTVYGAFGLTTFPNCNRYKF